MRKVMVKMSIVKVRRLHSGLLLCLLQILTLFYMFIDDGGLDQCPLAEGPSVEMYPLEADIFPTYVALLCFYPALNAISSLFLQAARCIWRNDAQPAHGLLRSFDQRVSWASASAIG
jgi:hypothetical protein